MTFYDLIISPLYLVCIYFVAYLIKNQNRRNHLIRKYFIPALTVRLIGASALGLIYFFYYGNGDTFNYYKDGVAYFSYFMSDPFNNWEIFFANAQTIHYNHYYLESDLIFKTDPATGFVSKTVAFTIFFSFGIYTVSAFLFAIIGLSGSWALFLILNKMYPELEKKLAFTCFFLPTLVFWGSGILKDTIAFSAMCWIIYSVYNIFILKKRNIVMIGIALFSAYVIYIVKLYILACLIPAVTPWIVVQINNNIRNKAFRNFLKPILYVGAIGIGLFGVGKISESNDRYSFDKIVATSQITAQYIKSVSDQMGGASYDIGRLEPTVGGVLRIILPAINVTLFRPYLWEVRNVLMLLSAAEAFYFLYLTIRLFFLAKIKTLSQTINAEPFLIFCLVFSIVFAFATGISTNNFGSLVRYKLPLLPLYLTAIYVLIERVKAKTAAQKPGRSKK